MTDADLLTQAAREIEALRQQIRVLRACSENVPTGRMMLTRGRWRGSEAKSILDDYIRRHREEEGSV